MRAVLSLLALLSCIAVWSGYCAVAVAAPVIDAKELCAQLQSSLPPSPASEEAEKWVCERLQAGRPANLKEGFANESERVLRPGFLVKLFTTSYSWPEKIRISHAVLTEPVTLTRGVILHDLALTDCQFEDDVSFADSEFRKGISFARSQFKTVNFTQAVFAGPVTFTGAEITRHLLAAEAQFSGAKAGVSFARVRVGGNVLFNKAVFQGLARFDWMQVGDTAFFNEAVFADLATFDGAEIRGQLQARKAQFVNPKAGAFFVHTRVAGRAVFDKTVFAGLAVLDRMHVGATLSFNEAILGGRVTFTRAEIRGQLQVRKAQFTHKNEAVFFTDARVEEIADFTEATFQGQALFERMYVGDTADFTAVEFAGIVLFNNAEVTHLVAHYAQFTHTGQPGVSFAGMRIRGDAFFTEATFKGAVNFDNAVLRHLQAQRTTFTNPKQSASFTGLRVEESVDFADATFQGQALFERMHVGDVADFTAVKFHGLTLFDKMQVGDTPHFIRSTANFSEAVFTSTNGAYFRNLHIGGDAFFNQAKFQGPVHFDNAVLRHLQAQYTAFTNPKKRASFTGLTVEKSADFTGAEFQGPVHFDNAVLRRLQAQHTTFTNAKQSASFMGLRVEESADFTGAEFRGQALFERMHVGETANFSEATFHGLALFDKMQVGDTAHFTQSAINFTDAVFKDPGGAFFRNMHVGGDAFFTAAQFGGPVYFAKTVLGGRAAFVDTVFVGSALLTQATFGDILIQEPDTQARRSADFKLLDISQTVVKGSLTIQNVTLHNFIAPFLTVEGSMSLNQVTLKDGANLQHSRLKIFALCNVTWPEPQGPDNEPSVYLEGILYQHISARNADADGQCPSSTVMGAVTSEGKEEEKDLLLALHDKAQFSPSIYVNLEAFFQRQGAFLYADEVFKTRKKRERREVLKNIDWWWNLVLDVFVGHGRNPGRALVWSILVVGLGCMTFRREHDMEPQSSEQGTPHNYNCLWYSLDLFLPFVELQMANAWLPKEGRRLARTYMRIHILLGWIMIPIGMAAISGIIQ